MTKAYQGRRDIKFGEYRESERGDSLRPDSVRNKTLPLWPTMHHRETQGRESEKDRSHSEKEPSPKVKLSPEEMVQLRKRLELLGRRLNRAQALADLRVAVHIVRRTSKKLKSK
jgi:hypothetical protein